MACRLVDELSLAYKKPFAVKPEQLLKLLMGQYLGGCVFGEKGTESLMRVKKSGGKLFLKISREESYLLTVLTRNISALLSWDTKS